MAVNSGEGLSARDIRTLREALKEATQQITLKQVLKITRQETKAELFGERAFRYFLAADGGIEKQNYDPLAAVWLRSPLGRVIRNLSASKSPPFDALTARLCRGNVDTPPGVTVAGNYFMYHGSYLVKNHYVVRVMAIKANDDDILSVTDTIREDKRAGRIRDRVAEGVMIFEGKCPQIILLAQGQENKVGLSLIFGSEADINDQRVIEQIDGSFAVVNVDGDVAYRRCLLLRAPDDSSVETMLDQAGIFSREELTEPKREKHRQAFDRLKRLKAHLAFVDPIEAW